MSLASAAVWIHAATTLALCGLIWFVQLVHYPLFHGVGSGFADYAAQHQRRTGWVVVPLMVPELVTAVVLVVDPPGGTAWPIAGLTLLLPVWLSTAFLQMPCHRRLSRGYDAATVRRLVGTNWLRTVAWTVRAPIALVILRDWARG